MIADINGNPIDFIMLPASESDIGGFRKIDLVLPANAVIYADKAYNDYKYEDYLVCKKQIHLIPIRKKNSKRRGSRFLEGIRKKKRRMIETAFSCLEKLMPRSIHAVTKKGFELKTLFFVLAYAFNRLMSLGRPSFGVILRDADYVGPQDERRGISNFCF